MKIISYAIKVNQSFYNNGLKKNIDIANELFHDWTVQIDKDYVKYLKEKTQI